MTVHDLQEELDARGFKRGFYSLAGNYVEDGLTLSKQDSLWQIEYCERGSRREIAIAHSEADACARFLDLMARYGSHASRMRGDA